MGFPIIAPEDIKNYEIDIVIISSKNSGDSIVKSLHKVSPESNYVDIYAELRNKGLKVYNNFFDERSIYTQIFDLQEQYKVAETKKEQEEILQKLVGYYFSIRDFYYANYYIDIYSMHKFINYELFISLRVEINDLLKEMTKINENRTEDVSLFYVDALRAKDVFDLETGKPKLLNKYTNCADIYTNVYSTGATTYESMVSAILGKYPLECDVYSRNFLRSIDEFKLLKQGYHNGYHIHWMVSDCYRLIEDDERAQFDIQIYMSKKLWNLACSIAEVKEKTFNFVYFPYEIHCPMLCGFHSVKPVIRGFSNMGIEFFPESIETQYGDCLNYMDKQFDFYYELLGKNTTKIIFSDHSQVVYDKNNNHKSYNMYYKDKELTSHIPVIVSKGSKGISFYNEYFSMVDFNELFLGMMEESNVTQLARDIIRYQYYPIHSAKIRFHAQEYGFEDYIDGIDIFVSDKYVYIKTGTGKEEVFLNKDLENNLLDTQEGKEYKNKVTKKYNIG